MSVSCRRSPRGSRRRSHEGRIDRRRTRLGTRARAHGRAGPRAGRARRPRARRHGAGAPPSLRRRRAGQPGLRGHRAADRLRPDDFATLHRCAQRRACAQRPPGSGHAEDPRDRHRLRLRRRGLRAARRNRGVDRAGAGAARTGARPLAGIAHCATCAWFSAMAPSDFPPPRRSTRSSRPPRAKRCRSRGSISSPRRAVSWRRSAPTTSICWWFRGTRMARSTAKCTKPFGSCRCVPERCKHIGIRIRCWSQPA